MWIGLLYFGVTLIKLGKNGLRIGFFLTRKIHLTRLVWSVAVIHEISTSLTIFHIIYHQ